MAKLLGNPIKIVLYLLFFDLVNISTGTMKNSFKHFRHFLRRNDNNHLLSMF